MLYFINRNFESLATVKRIYRETAPQVTDFESGTQPIAFEDWKREHVVEYELRDAIEEVLDDMPYEDLVELYNSTCSCDEDMILDASGINEALRYETPLAIAAAFRHADPDDDWFRIDSYYCPEVESSCYPSDLIDIGQLTDDIIDGTVTVDYDEIERIIALENAVALVSVLFAQYKGRLDDGSVVTSYYVETYFEDDSSERSDFTSYDEALATFNVYAEMLED